MLSYRHAFHAGNHADVLKHWVLSLIVRALLHKDKPFVFIDTHAGAGRYRLDSDWASQHREHETGIQRLWRSGNVPEALEPYLWAVRTTNPGRELLWYPGSPRIVRPFLRHQDRMVLCELHTSEARIIAREFEGDRQVRIESGDGYQALRAWLPPRERRGLVHIDPAYERRDERQRVLKALAEAHARWPTGIYALWYPIQDQATADDFRRRLQRLGIPRMLAVELRVLADEAFRLNGSGLILINPPWRLDSTLEQTLPWLWKTLSHRAEGGWRVTWLTGEAPARPAWPA